MVRVKKWFAVILCCFWSLSLVQAKGNKLYFTNSGDRLYYSTELALEDVFIRHNDMMPGKKYSDELVIENKTDLDYKLYLKILPSELGEKASALLDNIEMTVYLDDELIYDGYAKGLDYKKDGSALTEAILLGSYKENSTSILKVETMLRNDYTNNNGELAHLNMEFYAEYEEKVIPINPDTSRDDSGKMIFYLSGGGLAVILILFILRRETKLSRK